MLPCFGSTLQNFAFSLTMIYKQCFSVLTLPVIPMMVPGLAKFHEITSFISMLDIKNIIQGSGALGHSITATYKKYFMGSIG